MKTINKKLWKILIIGMMICFVAFTAEAKKKKDKAPYQGPVVEVCKTKKNGTEMCKDKKLKGQKAIIYIYQQLLTLGEISAANTALLNELNDSMDALQVEVDALTVRVDIHDQEIAANLSNISDLQVRYTTLRTDIDGHDTQLDDLTSRIDAMQGEVNLSADEIDSIQSELQTLRGSIATNESDLRQVESDLAAAMQTQQDALQALQADLEAEDTLLQSQITTLTTTIGQVQASIPSDADITAVVLGNQQIIMMQSDVLSLQNSRTQRNADIARIEADILRIDAALLELENSGGSDTSELEQTIAELDQRVSFLEASLTAPSNLLMSQIEMSKGNHSCAIMDDSTVQCWGTGYLGNGLGYSQDPQTTPVPVTGLSNVTQLALGSSASCALIDDGSVQCWGSGSYVGNGDTGQALTPVAVNGLTGVTQIAAGSSHTCAISGGSVYCWGYGGNGRLGNGSFDFQNAPVAVSGLTGVTQIASGSGHTCAISDGSVYCWGLDRFGQLGIGKHDGNGYSGTYTYSSTGQYIYDWDVATPVAVQGGLTGVTQIAVGHGNTCAISSGSVYCWGYGYYGEMGNGTTNPYNPFPVAVNDLTNALQIDIESSGTPCALLSDGSVACWGRSATRYGTGGSYPQTTPLAADLFSGTITHISMGYYNMCVTIDGAHQCLGYNRYGQLGDGTTSDANTPTTIRFLPPFLVNQDL